MEISRVNNWGFNENRKVSLYLKEDLEMTKMEKVKNFVKEHKKEIAIGAITLIGGCVVYGVCKKTPKIEKTAKGSDKVSVLQCFTVDKSGWENRKSIVDTVDFAMKDTLVDAVDFGDVVSVMHNEINMDDLSKLGEDLLKIDGVTKDNKICVSVNVCDVNKN